MFVLTGFHDNQVQYWEPARWVQRREHQKVTDPSFSRRTGRVTVVRADASSG